MTLWLWRGMALGLLLLLLCGYVAATILAAYVAVETVMARCE